DHAAVDAGGGRGDVAGLAALSAVRLRRCRPALLLPRGLAPVRDPGPHPAARPVTAWILLGAVVLAEIGYPLADGDLRTGLVLLTVVLGYAFSLAHAATTRGPWAAGALVLVTTLGGL